jgi:hypothetical protein
MVNGYEYFGRTFDSIFKVYKVVRGVKHLCGVGEWKLGLGLA